MFRLLPGIFGPGRTGIFDIVPLRKEKTAPVKQIPHPRSQTARPGSG